MPLSHGKVEVSLEGNVISAVFIGSFNAESVCEYGNTVKSIVMSLEDRSFVMLIDNTKLDGGTPEAFSELEAINAWVNNTRLKAKAFIINCEINKQIMLHRTPSLALQNVNFFSTHQEANAWLEKFI